MGTHRNLAFALTWFVMLAPGGGAASAAEPGISAGVRKGPASRTEIQLSFASIERILARAMHRWRITLRRGKRILPFVVEG